MTEGDWLTSADPTPMVQFLSGRASDRKLRQFACACGRRVWHLLDAEASRAALVAAEESADGVIPETRGSAAPTSRR